MTEPAPMTAETVRQIISRLERLSADSAFAHRAAGLRGSLLELLEELEAGGEPPAGLSQLVEHSFDILVQAARDYPGDEEKINLAGER